MRLELQQPGMARRQANSTRYVPYQRHLLWRLDWRLPAADDALLTDSKCGFPLRQANHDLLS